MDKIDFLQKVIDYIEENLKAELKGDELAGVCGFSTYHFYRIFGEYVGMPVFAFITNRRLKHAIYEASCGKPLIESALEYGFNTHAGFFKAFKTQYGCSPRKYLKLIDVKKPLMFNLREEIIMLTQSEVKNLLSNWELGKKLDINSCGAYGGHLESKTTWYIGDDYVLKTGRNIPGLRTHVAIARALEREGMMSPVPVKTKCGQEFLVNEDQFYVLLTRVEGNFLTPEERYSDNRSSIGKKYGEAIGKLHKVFEKHGKDMELAEHNIYNTVMRWAMPKTKTIMEQWGCPLPQEFFNEYVEGFKYLHEKLPYGVIHRDPNPSNIIFNKGEVSGIIDFELGERNFRLFDPCYCATGILSEALNVEGNFDKWPDILKGIIDGYNSICPLTKEEFEAIPYIIYSIQMIFIAFLDGKEDLKEMSMMNRKMVLWMWENKEKCFGELI